MEFNVFKSTLKAHPEIHVVFETDSSISVRLRSNIEFFDEDAVERVLSSEKIDEKTKNVLRHLQDIVQEYVVECMLGDDMYISYRAVCTDKSSDVFCNPFCDLGGFQHVLRKCYLDSSMEGVADILVAIPKTFNVLDAALLHRLVKWVDENHVLWRG